MASCADDTVLTSMIEFLLAAKDNTGVNEHLVMVMLDERREHPIARPTAAKLRQQQPLSGPVLPENAGLENSLA